MHAAVRNDVVAATLTEMFYEMDRMRSLPVGDDELADARNYMTGVFSLGVATQDGMIGQLSTVYLNRLPEDYLETYRERIRALSSADVLAAARRHFDSPNAQIVIVGDREQVGEQAALFGEMKQYDAQGKRNLAEAPLVRARACSCSPYAHFMFACMALLDIAAAGALKKHLPDKPIDLNTATADELQQLPAVGPTMAKAIVDFREKSGPFRRVEDLLAIRGITKERLEKIRPYVKIVPPDSKTHDRPIWKQRLIPACRSRAPSSDPLKRLVRFARAAPTPSAT